MFIQSLKKFYAISYEKFIQSLSKINLVFKKIPHNLQENYTNF